MANVILLMRKFAQFVCFSLVLPLAISGCQRNQRGTAIPASSAAREARPAIADPLSNAKSPANLDSESRRQKEILLLQQLCLHQFDEIMVERVYGIHAQSFITHHRPVDDHSPPTLYLAIGRKEDGTWVPPPKELIGDIDSKGIQSVSDAKEADTVFFVESINWIDAETVTVDLGTYHRSIGFAGSLDVRLEFNDESWQIKFEGGCWVVPQNRVAPKDAR